MKYVLSLLVIAAMSCNSSDTTEETTQTEFVEAEEIPLLTESETCFLYTVGTENQDSTFVSLQMKGDSVVGFMHWQPWQKDGAYGTIAATKEGDTIFGVYNYIIEGSNQKEEVLFKTLNGKLIKGEGELKEELGDVVMLKFKDIGQVKYENIFEIITCEQFVKY